MKKIVILFASVAFMASSAFANPTATITQVTTAVQTVGGTSAAMQGVNAAIVTAAVAANKSMEAKITQIAAEVENVSKSGDDEVNGMSKKERVEALANIYAASVLTKEGYDVVERLFMGKVFDALTGNQKGDDKLDAANIAKFATFLDDYTNRVSKGEATKDAAQAASQAATGQDYAAFLEACGSAGKRR